MSSRWPLLGIGLLAAGCNKAPDDWVNLDVPVTAPASGWVRYENASAGFTIDLPKAWMVETGKPDETQAIFVAIRQTFPNLGDLSLSGGDVGNFDLKFTDLDPEHLKIGVLQSGGLMVDTIKTDYRSKDVAQVSGLQQMGNKMTTVGPGKTTVGPYMHLKYLREVENLASHGRSQAHTHLYYFGRERTFWIVSFTFAVDNAKAMEPLVDEILATIRFKKPDMDAVKSAREKVRKEASDAVAADRKAKNEAYEREGQAKYQEMLRMQEAERVANEERKRQAALEQQAQQQQQQQAPPQQEPPPIQQEQPPIQETPPPDSGNAMGGKGEGG